MKAITIQQPWASAIATGHKHVENRGRSTPWTSAIAQRIAIHAGKTWDADARYDERLIRAAKDAGHLFVSEELDPQAYRYGVILATAVLTDVHQDSQHCRCGSGRPHSWAEPDQLHLILRDIQAIIPAECRGALGLWTVPEHVLGGAV